SKWRCSLALNSIWRLLSRRRDRRPSGWIASMAASSRLAMPSDLFGAVNWMRSPTGSVRRLGDEFLAQINHSQQEPLQVVTLRSFMENVFLPFVKSHKRANTHKGYAEIWRVKKSEFRMAEMYDIINACYKHNAQLVIAGNMTKTDLDDKNQYLEGTFRHIEDLTT